MVEPNNQVIADRGFNVKEDLMVVQSRLAIPPSTCGNIAMSSGDVSEIFKIANVSSRLLHKTCNKRKPSTVLKKTFHCASKSCIHMFVALLIAQKFLLKLRQALTLRLSVGETIQ
jgi:hypothetical protein